MKNNKIKKIVFSESSFDFKYKNIFHGMSLKIVEGSFTTLIKGLLINNGSIYHIRYIKYRNLFHSILRYLIIFLICKMSHSKIIWTCHNIYEHKIKYKKINNILRYFISLISTEIIIFHKDLISFFPKQFHQKIHIACFGDFKGFLSQKKRKNDFFLKKYEGWISDVKEIHIISISAAKRNNINFLIQNSKTNKKNTLIIAPKISINKKSFNSNNNIFVYNNFVYSEIEDILNSNNNMIGFIGHNNNSVPTSIYMFASYGIPVIGLNISPINSIINENNIGKIVDNNSFNQQIELIQNNYQEYQTNCYKFIQINSWSKSSKIHRNIFK